MKKTNLILFVSAIMMIGVSTAALGQSLTGGATATAIGQPDCTSNTTGTMQASCVLVGSQVIAPPNSAQWDDAASAQAIANFGVLHSNSSATGSCEFDALMNVGCSNDEVAFASASATFNDILFVTNAPSVGVVQIGFAVTGSVNADCGLTANCGQEAFADIVWSGASAGAVYNPGGSIRLTGGSSIPTLSLNYNWTGFSGSIAVPISISLLTFAVCGVSETSTDACNANAKFSNTAIVTGVQIFDTNGNLIPNAVVTSASGTNYNNLVPSLFTVPNVVGSNQSAASAAIVGSGLIVGIITSQASTTVPAGTVISQDPAAGASVADGSLINLVVSSGPTVAERLAALLAEVKGVGPGQSLANDVALAETYYAANDVPATCSVLTGFLNEVKAQNGKKIGITLDAQLIAEADTIETAIACN